MSENKFLPICKKDMEERGWEQLDFVYISGDAYVDHPSFGHAIITRLLEAHGFKVGIIAQPDWKDKNSITILGEPRLGFLVSAGNMDSMVNHYSVSKKHRRRSEEHTSELQSQSTISYAGFCLKKKKRKKKRWTWEYNGSGVCRADTIS